MPGSQRYHLQIEKLKELMTYLHNFEAEVRNAVNNYKARLAGLVEQGLPAEVGKKVLEDFYQQSKNLSSKNTAVINEQAIPYIAHNVKTLEQLIGR